jgi:hypothetical protein
MLGVSSTRPVFIIGSGRSGTHWLANTLATHPEVCSTIEIQPMFGLSQQMALNPFLRDTLFDQLASIYRQQLYGCHKSVYLDKSHPNIWIAEQLINEFSDALFLGIQRNPYATVASMLRHKGVLSWHQRWCEFPIPNAFLGITMDLADQYEEIPIAAKCALRWLAHSKRMNELRGSLGTQLLVTSYETFQKDTSNTIQGLQKFLGLSSPLAIPHIRQESLLNWQSQLSGEEQRQIQDIVGTSTDGGC